MVTTLDNVGNQSIKTISPLKVKGIFTALSLFGLLVGCAPMSMNLVGDNSSALVVQNATPQGDHLALAKRFEDAAAEVQAKADEQKRLLEQYEKEHVYGWQSHTMKSNTLALIRKYEQAARSNMKEALSHRQMAQKSKHNYAIHGTLRSNSTFREVPRGENN